MSVESVVRPKKPGTNKRAWTFDEESKLVEVLIELNNVGGFKAERGFKPGYAKAIADLLETKLPGHGIKAKPHIESKIRTLKLHFGVVHDMLTGNNCSGFGWDADRKCVTAENAVWDEYLKSHQDAEPFRFKSFPFYEELCIAFGKDRATGKNAESAADIVEELDKETENEDSDSSTSFFDTAQRKGNNGSPKAKRSRNASVASLSNVIKESTATMTSEIGKATDKLCQALGDAEYNEKKSIINSVLMKIPKLSMVERHKATRKIGCDKDTTDIFFTIPDEEKLIWVQALLKGEI